jgi:phosphonate transport system substrate-binding protein
LRRRNTRILPAIVLLLATACEHREQQDDAGKTEPSQDIPITLGDIERDHPATRIRRLQPLVDYLGEHLADLGIGRGRVVIARDIDEMCGHFRDGTVDAFLDSPFTVLAIRQRVGGNILLRRWAKDDPEYWSVFIALRDSPVTDYSDLAGQVILLQEPHSTSGYFLPATTLLQQGFELKEVSRPDETVSPHEIGFYFSRDEENTVEMVLTGISPVGVISNQDYRELPQEMKDRLTIVERTASVPRQIVLTRPGLPAAVVERIRELLLGLTDADREALAAKDEPFGWTWKFDELSEESTQTLAELEVQVKRLQEIP